jgi:Holliday junction DNA helicase RuvB
VLGLSAPEEAVRRIAERSRATPRVANALLKRVRDFAEVHNKEISAELCDEACILFGVDALGLTKDDRRYLEVLQTGFRGGPAGVRALASAMSEDEDTVEQVYEPHLLRLGFIERSPRGRMLTSKGRAHIAQQ